MKIIRQAIWLIALFIIPTQSYAQHNTEKVDTTSLRDETPLSLKECQTIALENSSTLKASEAQSQAYLYELKAAKSDFLPSLSAAASSSYYVGSPEGENIAPGTLRNLYYTSSLTLRQNIYAGGTTTHSTKAAALSLEISELNTLRTRQEILYTAETSYWSYIASLLQLKAMEDYLATTEELLRSIEIRYSEGYTSRLDLLMIKTRRQEALVQLNSAQQQCLVSLQSLNTAMGNTQEQKYLPTDTLSLPGTILTTQDYSYALSHRYDLQSYQTNEELQRENISVTRSLYNPQLWLSLEGYYGTPTPNYPTSTNALYGVAKINFSATIFEFGKRRKSVQAAKQTAVSATHSTEELRKTIAGELSTALTNIQKQYDQSILSHRSLEIAAENLSLNIFSYEQGTIPILDVLSSQLSWISAQTTYIDSLYGYALAVAAYRLAVGEF